MRYDLIRNLFDIKSRFKSCKGLFLAIHSFYNLCFQILKPTVYFYSGFKREISTRAIAFFGPGVN